MLSMIQKLILIQIQRLILKKLADSDADTEADALADSDETATPDALADSDADNETDVLADSWCRCWLRYALILTQMLILMHLLILNHSMTDSDADAWLRKKMLIQILSYL